MALRDTREQVGDDIGIWPVDSQPLLVPIMEGVLPLARRAGQLKQIAQNHAHCSANSGVGFSDRITAPNGRFLRVN